MAEESPKPLSIPTFQTKLPAEFIEGLDERGKYLYQTIDKMTQTQDWLTQRAVADANTLGEVKAQTYKTNGRLLNAEADIKALKIFNEASEEAMRVSRKAADNAYDLAKSARAAAADVQHAAETAASEAMLAREAAKEAAAHAETALKTIDSEKSTIKTVHVFEKVIKNKWFWVGLLVFFTFGVPWLGSHSHGIIEFLKVLIAG